ncbi:MAG: AI-2E family transporter [Sphingomonadales bacterium]|nr:AI-2E family transporter [Sphingomonadales bacterium]
MSESRREGANKTALAIVAAGVVLAILVLGRTFLLPLAIAVLLFSTLDAIIDWIESHRVGPFSVPRWLATIAGIGFVVTAIYVVIQVLSAQVGAIGEVGPRYIARLQELFADIVAFVGEDVEAKAVEALNNLDLASTLSGVAGSAGSFLANAILVAIYTGFMLASQAHFPAKMAAMFPSEGEAERITNILDTISLSIRRYLWVKSIMSVLTGLASYVVLKVMGVDFAETWALLIFLLNYIPNIGSILGVIFPALIAIVQFDTLTPFLIIAVGLGAIQFTIGNILEPKLMGDSLNLSSLVVILSLTFWGAIWGIVGMFLSVPITVMLLIVCSHVPGWRNFAILLSRDGQIAAINQPAR